MTENTCYSHVSYNDNINIGSVGQAIPLCDVKLSKQKEISQSIIEIVGKQYQDSSKTHRGDESGKSITYFNAWWFDDGSTLQVYCTAQHLLHR